MAPRLNPVPDTPPRVVGYIRVSTAREEMISPELQRQAIEDHCARRGYILDEVIEDLDATGRNFARKGVQRAISRVENADITVVVVWKFSRFGRNRKGWALNLARVEEAGGRLESATEDVDTRTSTGKLSRGMLAEIAAFESDRIGETWQEAHENRIANGLPHSGHKRFGYFYHRTTRQIRDGISLCPQGCELGACETGYVLDPATAPMSAEIYLRYNRGDGIRAIAVALNEQGYTTAQGADWLPNSVRAFLHTGFAVGLIRSHPSDCPCKIPNVCERSTYVTGRQPTVFGDAATAAQVWETYRANRKRRSRYPSRTEAATYTLAGLLACALCGRPMMVQGHTWPDGRFERGYRYYCSRSLRTRLCESSGSINRSEIEGIVRSWVEELAEDEDLGGRAERVKVQAAARAVRQVDRKSLLRQQQEIAAALTRLTIDLARKLVPEAAYTAARAELEHDSAQIQEQLDTLARQETSEPKGPPVHLARDLSAMWEFVEPHRRREMLALLVERITIDIGGSTRRRQYRIIAATTWEEEVILRNH